MNKKTDCERCNGECHADCDDMRSAPANAETFERERFEAWLAEKYDDEFYLLFDMKKKYYIDEGTEYMWQAWLASKRW